MEAHGRFWHLFDFEILVSAMGFEPMTY